MALTVNTNTDAMNASLNLNQTENNLQAAMRHLSSGLRINSAADDVAGYAISQRLQSQVNGLNQARLNSQDAVSLAQTAQGALSDVANMLQRVRELAVQYANGTTSASDKEAIEAEAGQLKEEIKRVGETTQFNGVNLLKEEAKIAFQVGANEKEQIEVTTIALAKAVEKASVKEIKTIEESISAVTKSAGEFGAVQNRIQYTETNLEIYSQNLSSAVSGIVDVNMAAEMTEFTKDQVLQQAGVAILAQANQIPDAVLKLLG
jgi:flagellin